MRRDSAALYKKLHGGLTDVLLRERGSQAVLRLFFAYPGYLDMLRLKALMAAAQAACR